MSVSLKTRAMLRERSSGDSLIGLCERCGQVGNNAHHRKNRSQCGRDVLSNLILLCGSGTTGCHGYVTEHPKWAEDNGYTIKGELAVPADVPVELLVGRVLLDDYGHWVEAEDVA